VQAVREGMMATMRPGGSGWRVAVGAPYVMAGKTGTAQVISRKGTAAVNPKSLPMHLRHRALFVGFAPVENPVIAIAVAVEGGGYGGSAAAPIARKVFDAYLLGKMPEGMQPLDSERGTTAIGATAFDNEDAGARQAGDLAAAQLGEHPVLVGVPAPEPHPHRSRARRPPPRCRPRHARPSRSPHDESVPALGRRHAAPLLQHAGLGVVPGPGRADGDRPGHLEERRWRQPGDGPGRALRGGHGGAVGHLAGADPAHPLGHADDLRDLDDPVAGGVRARHRQVRPAVAGPEVLLPAAGRAAEGQPADDGGLVPAQDAAAAALQHRARGWSSSACRPAW
jgi:hypothetical protein